MISILSQEGLKKAMHWGLRLRQERQRRHLSQEALAEALGTSARSISRWEQGQAIPQGYARLQLCRLFGLRPEELFGESETWTPPELPWTVPFPRNPCFTGREEILRVLHDRLTASQPVALTQASALSGLGGVGKTQVAIEYAYRYAAEYQAIFWLGAETSESLMAGLQQIANQLQLPERQATEQPQMVAAVQQWLAAHARWLLIVDNLEDLAMLQTVLPVGQRGSLLLTTRRQALGLLAEPLELPPMSSEEGVSLVLRRARRLHVPTPDAPPLPEVSPDASNVLAATELVALLDGLPLALDQAGAYIEETGCSVGDYLQRYREQRHHVLARRGIHAGAHPASVTATLLLAIERVRQEHAPAIDLLRICAFLHPETIPEELFVTGATHLGPLLSSVAADPFQFDLALAALRSASLVTRHREMRMLSVHRLVQAVLQDQMKPDEKQVWSQRIVRMVNAAFPVGEFHAWATCERCLVQALACVPLLAQMDSDLPEASELLYKVGGYLVERGRYEEAEPLLERAVALGEQQHGTTHLSLALALEKQAELFWQREDHAAATALLQRVLTMKEHHLGPVHPQVGETLSNLAIISAQQGAYEQAVTLCQRALSICEQRSESDPTELGRALNNLATIYRYQGNHDQAELLFQRVLTLYEQHLGPTHPDTALPLNNLATLYRTQGKYEQAEALYQRALAIYEQHLGSEHADTALMLNNLAVLYHQQGNHERAEPLFQHVLAIRERQLGPEHPKTAQTLSHLATVYREQGKYEQAEILFQRILCRGEIKER